MSTQSSNDNYKKSGKNCSPLQTYSESLVERAEEECYVRRCIGLRQTCSGAIAVLPIT